MMRDLRLRCRLIIVAAVLLASTASHAQGPPSFEREVRELKAKLFFVSKLDAKYPVSGYSGTWALLEEDAAVLSGKHKDEPAFALIHQQVLLSWARTLESREKAGDALARYGQLIRDYGQSAEGYREACAASAKIHMSLADAADSDATKLSNLVAAQGLYTKLGDTRAAEGIQGAIVDLKSREGIRLFEAREYETAFRLLKALENEFGGDLGSGRAGVALATIRAKTGVLAIGFIEVKAEGVDIDQGGVLHLSPRSDGDQTEWKIEGDAPKIRWTTGEYDYALFLSGSEQAVLTGRARLTTSGTTIELPNRVPAGMTYVPAGGEVARPFFIDRTEVPAAAYRKFDSDYELPRGDTDAHPARGIGWKKAEAFAVSVGKKLPTPEQWHRAAFGETNFDYPWGDAKPDNRCNIGSKAGRPSVVDAYPTGASPCGALNMAGNVWEWLRNGYAIGGGYRLARLSSPVPGAGWTANFLRDGKPAPEVFRDLPGAQQRRLNKYKVTDSNLMEVGFRCVIEL